MCACACGQQPGTIGKVSRSTMPFPMRENIKAFCDACRALGYVQTCVHRSTNPQKRTKTCTHLEVNVCLQACARVRVHSRVLSIPRRRTNGHMSRVPDRDNFTTDDLFEQRNMKQVRYMHAREHDHKCKFKPSVLLSLVSLHFFTRLHMCITGNTVSVEPRASKLPDPGVLRSLSRQA